MRSKVNRALSTLLSRAFAAGRVGRSFARAGGMPAGLMDFAAPELQQQLDALRNQVPER